MRSAHAPDWRNSRHAARGSSPVKFRYNPRSAFRPGHSSPRRNPAGGGGIPVLEQDNHLRGASAVIEKDLAAGKLAEGINADLLIILTNVEKVCINLGKPNEEPLDTITVDQAKTYMEEGHFGIYNMLPKFRAAVEFVEGHEGRKAYITSFDKVSDALNGKTGTVIE